jgi:hypothetical protein
MSTALLRPPNGIWTMRSSKNKRNRTPETPSEPQQSHFSIDRPFRLPQVIAAGRALPCRNYVKATL